MQKIIFMKQQLHVSYILEKTIQEVVKFQNFIMRHPVGKISSLTNKTACLLEPRNFLIAPSRIQEVKKIDRLLSTNTIEALQKEKKRKKNSGKIGKKKIFEIPFGFRTQREMRTLKRDEHKFGSFISPLFLIYPGPKHSVLNELNTHLICNPTIYNIIHQFAGPMG